MSDENISPYLRKPVRSRRQALLERAQRAVEEAPASEWLPWDLNVGMYADETETSSPAPVVGVETTF